MPMFEVVAPNGKQYEIEGPNQAGAVAALQKHLAPTLDQLGSALINADKAGDVEAARALAGEIKRMRGAASAAQPDYSKMSDADLMAIVQPKKSGPWDAFAKKGPWEDYANMSDEDLLKIVNGTSVAGDVAKSAGVGVAKGGIGLAGAVGDLSNLGAKGIEIASNFVADRLGVERYKRPEQPSILNNIPTSKSIRDLVETQTGEFYKPQTKAGRYAETIGEFLPGSMIGPGGIVAKVGTGTAAALGSEAAGQATEGTKAEPWARVAGALLGGVAPLAAGRVVTPLPATAARQRLVDVLENEGVNSLTAGQRTGNKSLQYAETFLGDGPLAGQGATRIQDQGQRQFTEAAMRRAGAGPDATPEVLAQNSQRLGNEFEQLSARNNLTPDNQFVTDIVDAARHYRRVPDSQQRQMVQGYIDDIIEHVNNGSMPGPQYQEMRSRLSREANSLRESDPTLSQALRDMRNALDHAMERSKAGEAMTEGQISPSALRNTVSAENRGAYARGQGDFSELARAGAGVMQPLPNSGTAQRNLLTNLAMLPVTATAGRLITSRPVQGYLGNQLLARTMERAPTVREAIARALLAQQIGGQ
jgi:hypothetical protein